MATANGTRGRGLALAAGATLGLVLLVGCASNDATGSFRPNPAVDHSRGIAAAAIPVPEGEAGKLMLLSPKPIVVGRVGIEGGSLEDRKKKALCIAAREGGTHVVLRGHGFENESYLVMRVAREQWPQLSEELRPSSIDESQQQTCGADLKSHGCQGTSRWVEETSGCEPCSKSDSLWGDCE